MRTSPLLAPPWSLCPYNERSPPESTAKRLPPRGRPASRGHLLRAALEREEAPLRGESPGVTTQAAVGRDDTMTGHHDRDRIRPKCAPCRARGLLVPGLSRHLAVRGDLPIGNAGRRREDPSLERRERREIDGDIEGLPAPGKVLVELDQEAVAAASVGKHAGTVRPGDPRELALVGSRAVVDRDHASRTDRDPERTERRIHDVVADGDEPFASRPSEQPFARVVHQGCQGRHRIASFSFFIASATRERAASSLHSSTAAISAYARPSTLRSTNAARCPGGSVRTAAARSAMVTPSRSGAARRRSASGTRRFVLRARSTHLFVAILYSHARSLPLRGGGHARNAARKVSWKMSSASARFPVSRSAYAKISRSWRSRRSPKVTGPISRR